LETSRQDEDVSTRFVDLLSNSIAESIGFAWVHHVIGNIEWYDHFYTVFVPVILPHLR
jgi:hypothetical protein